MDTSTELSPSKLFSPNFHSKEKRAWFLLKFYIKKSPPWGIYSLKSKLCIFREIAYVDENNELIGLGRSYLPFNYFGIIVFWNCISFIDPKPLGVVLKMKYGSNIEINVISMDLLKKNITPFRNELTEVVSYKRVLSINNGSHIVLAEEDFIK